MTSQEENSEISRKKFDSKAMLSLNHLLNRVN